MNHLIITQDELIKQIANKEDTDVAMVRKILKTTDDIVFDHLSSTTPSENVFIKVLNGLTIEGKYIQEKIITRGLFKKTNCSAKIKAKANISEYYNRKLNGYFD